jgi:putative tricarboxylic transport membrane protein
MSATTPDAARAGRIAAALVALGALAYGAAGVQIEYAFSSDPIGPRGFPVGLAVILILLAAWYFVQPGDAEPWPRGRGLTAAITFLGLSVLCVLGMPIVGFVPAMTVLMAAVARLFGASPPLSAASGLGQAILWWALFGPLLGGTLPKGPLGF